MDPHVGRTSIVTDDCNWHFGAAGLATGAERTCLAAAYVGLSLSTVRYLSGRGDFRTPIALTKGRLVWLREDLDGWLDRKAGRASATPKV